jgi:hypothetical protein
MEYKLRSYPQFSACGLNCGLCPRYHTTGISRCPGCAGEGFSDVHPACGILSCCQRKGIEYCHICEGFPCKKYDKAGLSDSFITHRNQFSDFEKAKLMGIEAYASELNEKIHILEYLLENFNSGRQKNLFCVAVNLLDLEDAKVVVEQLRNDAEQDTPLKEKALMAARLFEEMAEKRNISLKLRK